MGMQRASPDISYSNPVSAATLGSCTHVRALEDRAILGFFTGGKWGVRIGMEEQVPAVKPVHGVPLLIRRRGPLKPAFPAFPECPRSVVTMGMRNAGEGRRSAARNQRPEPTVG